MLTGSKDYGPQLDLLWHQPFSESFQEFIFLLVREAAAAGAIYARHLDDATISTIGEVWEHDKRVLPFRRAVQASAALSGTELMPEPVK